MLKHIRQNSLTSLRYSVADEGNEMQKPKAVKSRINRTRVTKLDLALSFLIKPRNAEFYFRLVAYLGAIAYSMDGPFVFHSM